MLGVLLPHLGPYLELRGIGAVGIGLVTGAVSLAKVVYVPVIGGLVDRGRWLRGLLTGHTLLAAGAALAVIRIPGGPGIGVAFFMVGLGFATVLPIVEASVLESIPAGGYGGVRVWGSVGFVVAATATGPLLAGGSLTAFPLLLAGILVLLAVTCVPFERLARPERRQEPGPLPLTAWLLLIVLMLHQIAHGPYYAFFSVDLKAHGMSSSAIGWLWSVGVIAESAAFLGGWRLERRFGLRRLLGLALLLTPLRWLLLALPPFLPVLLIAQAGHAVTFAVAHLAGIQLVRRATPPGSARRAQALYSGLTFGLGIVIGSALAGPVYAAGGGRSAFLAAAALSWLVFVLWIPLARHLGRERIRPASR